MMRPFHRITIGLSSIALSLVLPAGTAVATSGTFGWVGPKGKTYSLQNPPDRKCLNMSQEARGARNSTKRPLAVYAGKSCRGHITHLAPGQSAPSGARFSSVMFNPS
ncbi:MULTISPECIES: hypothetical protein [unclassified Streptomyces]|uniref:hypothetical protein n=2 Tax=unclassified Streptomyces TaxID=2593676 RepID=UPI000C2785B5|nr:hypothetical protein CG747_23325 [Streptomyces sp. CB02959]